MTSVIETSRARRVPRRRIAAVGPVLAAGLGAAVLLAGCASNGPAPAAMPLMHGNAPWMMASQGPSGSGSSSSGSGSSSSGSGSSSSGGGSSSSGSGSSSSGSGSSSSQVIDLTIKDVKTPEGSEPAYVGPSGTGAAVLFHSPAGKTVTVTVKNTDSMPHTFTVPNLNLNEDIGPNATVRFSFSAPAGTYSWYCQVPCGNWVMSHVGYMKGSFTITA